ncbi:membrane fusion protein [Rhizobium sp. BK529]|uniref:HlyD family type I secretion periplasmic adaptor subunit n=1 Tax=unclassified Rhizobium TaxID=2613769 RepID=UPI0010EF1DC0|nr:MULTISPECIES: HlyD family type I secretion periplasmic adaptor subunit [unclassified Rhizobium]MBB3591261.1 membrane fusion protein [Rhizobium sp. BK529]TCS08787.1 membrane fusion protein PrsE [Rhizobium sp. BK418]
MKRSQHSLNRHILSVWVLSIALVGGMGGWAASTSLSNAVVGQGTVIIDQNVKKIQHLTGGIVSELKAMEGAHVQAGDVLLRLDSTSVKANLAIIDSNLAQLYVRRARLQAERIGATKFSADDIPANDLGIAISKSLIDGEVQLFNARQSSLVGMRKQLEERKAQLSQEIQGDTLQLASIDEATKLVDQEYDAASKLYDQKIVTMQKVNGLKRQRVELDGNRGERLSSRAQAEGKIAEINLQILQLDEDRRTENSKDLTDVDAKTSEMQERRIAAVDQMNRLELRAPMSGRIYQMTVHTVGGVVNPGEVLMLLAPDQRDLTIEAKIATRDIDQLTIGRKVDIRFSAFDQKTTPEVQGDVVSISPDVVTDQRSGADYYPVRIKPEPASLAKLTNLALYPGMPAEVFIKVADRTVLSYMTKPLMDQISHTFREQ